MEMIGSGQQTAGVHDGHLLGRMAKVAMVAALACMTFRGEGGIWFKETDIKRQSGWWVMLDAGVG